MKSSTDCVTRSKGCEVVAITGDWSCVVIGGIVVWSRRTEQTVDVVAHTTTCTQVHLVLTPTHQPLHNNSSSCYMIRGNSALPLSPWQRGAPLSASTDRLSTAPPPPRQQQQQPALRHRQQVLARLQQTRRHRIVQHLAATCDRAAN